MTDRVEIRGLYSTKSGYSVRKLKGIDKKNLGKFNNFLGFLWGGFDFMDGKVSLNSNVMSPVCKDFCDKTIFIKIINLFSNGASFGLKGIKRGFKDTSTASYNNGWRFSFPENSLKVCIKGFNFIRQRFVGVGLWRFRIVFENIYKSKRWRKLKVFNRFSDVFVSLKGCFGSYKNRVFTVRTLTETVKLDILKGFVCNCSLSCYGVGVHTGNNSSSFFNAVRTYEFNSIHRGLLCYLEKL